MVYSTDSSRAVGPGVSLNLCCFVVYSTRRFVLCLTYSTTYTKVMTIQLCRFFGRETKFGRYYDVITFADVLNWSSQTLHLITTLKHVSL